MGRKQRAAAVTALLLPHPQDANCGSCHPTMEENSFVFRDPESHINGIVDLGNNADAGCSTCHGDATSSAPPKDLAGNTAVTSPGVGAHRAHLATATWSRQTVFSDCHTVPTTQGAPGHIDGDNIAELTFGPLNPAAQFTKANSTCSNLYCHGNGRGNNGTAVFTDTTDLACNGCHNTNGNGMSGEHGEHIGEGIQCRECHSTVVSGNQGNWTIIAPNLHINGAHDVVLETGTYNAANKSCSNTGNGCHNGTPDWN